MIHRFITSLLFTLTFVLCFAAGPLQAQETDDALPESVEITVNEDVLAWRRVAERAEVAIATGRASSGAFEQLRRELVDWREIFQHNQSANESAIRTLQTQIDVLGAKPEDVTEAPEITAKRSDLEQRMTLLQAPVKTAVVAHSRADGLIRGIDEIIRSRQTDALLKLGPSPLNPVHWRTGGQAVRGILDNLRSETAQAIASPAQQVLLKNNLPIIVVLLLAAFVLLLRARYWMERLSMAVEAKTGTKVGVQGRWILVFLLSIAQLALPLIGLLLFSEAIYATEMVGVRGDVVLSSIVTLGVIFMVARWLGGRTFPKSEQTSAALNLNSDQRAKGRIFAAALGVFVGLDLMVARVSQFENWSSDIRVVLVFPVLLLIGYVLLRLAKFLQIHVQNEQVQGESRSYRNGIIYYLGRVIMILAIIGPVLAAIGYFQAAQSIVIPLAMSLGLLALLMILQRMSTEIYALLIGSSERAREALIPVLVNFLLVLGAAPFFALIWGARTTDLAELWARFQAGVPLGDARISPAVFMTFAIIFAIGYMLTRLLQGTLRNTVLPKTKLDLGGRNAITSGIGYIGIFLAALVAISSAGIDLSSLAIVAGALSVGIGFGLQNIVSNFVAGIILLIERPISQGDWIEVGGQMGIVRDISVRSTRIETFDRTDVIVPNSDFVSGVVTNWTRGNSIGRVIVKVGVAYGNDTKRIEGLLRKIAQAHPMVLANPAPLILFSGFGESSLDFEIRAILRDVNWKLSVNSDLNHEIARVFAEEDIEIPFAQRDLWLRNPEVLQAREKDGG